MHTEKVDAQDLASVSLVVGAGANEQAYATGIYEVKCFNAEGNLKWEDKIQNIVVTVGKANLLNVYLAAATQSTTWYLGLVDGASTPTYNVTNTIGVGGHPGWTENTGYAGANRPTAAFTVTATNSISTGATSFTINASGIIAGALLVNDSTKGGTTGTLYSVGNFTGDVSRSVISGDSLIVTYTASV
jgi:hypothetical protein